MSATLLQRVSDHLAFGGLLDGYAVRYFRWTDDNASEPTILFRMAGSQGGLTDFSVQYPDVQVTLIGTATTVVADSERCREIYQYVRENYQFIDYNWELFYPAASIQRSTIDEAVNEVWPESSGETVSAEPNLMAPPTVVKLLNIEPLAAVSGPFYLADGRPWFQLDFRVLVSDH